MYLARQARRRLRPCRVRRSSVEFQGRADAVDHAIDREHHDLPLKQAALAKGVSEELFDKVVNPLALARPGSADIPRSTDAG